MVPTNLVKKKTQQTSVSRDSSKSFALNYHQVAFSPHREHMVPAPLIVKMMIIWFKGKVSALQPRAIHSSAGNLKVIERQGKHDTRRRGVNEGVKVETSQAPNLEIPGAWFH